MRFVGNRRKQWSGYIILALTIGLAWFTRNRPRYRSRFPYETNTPRSGTSGSAAGAARVYDNSGARAAATATASTAGAARVYDRAEDPSPYLTRRLDPAEVDQYRNRRRALWWLVPLLLIPFLVCMLAWLVARNGGINNTPSSAPAAVQVDPQRTTGGSVTLDRVVAPQNSWVALYRTDANGQPDLHAPLGTLPIGAGESTDVNVPLDQPVASGEQVAAVLHADNGATGTFEPNGADTPLLLDNGSTATTFALGAAGVLAAAAQASSSPPQPQPPVGSGSAQASASGTQAGSVGASAVATPSTASGASGSAAALAGAAAGQGTSTAQIAAADATATGTADMLGAAAGAAGAVTAESDLTATADAAATTTTDAIAATPDTSTVSAATSTATNDATTAEAIGSTFGATASAGTSIAVSGTTTTSADATPDATTRSTADATNNDEATAVAGDTALASGTATGDTTTPEATAAALNVNPNEASIVAAQQGKSGDTVTLDRVVAPTDGWVAVYRRNADGTPNYDDRLGSAPVQQGENTDVSVPLTEVLGADDVVAVLHTDAGTINTFDDPDSVDLPVTANGALVAATIAASDVVATGTDQTAASDQTAVAPAQATIPPASEPVAEQTTAPAATEPTDAASTAATNSVAPNVTAELDRTATPTEAVEPARTATPTVTAAPTNTVEPTQTATASAAPTATSGPTQTATSAPTTAPTIAPTTTATATATGAVTATPEPIVPGASASTADASAAGSAASGVTEGGNASASSSPSVGAGTSASPSPQGAVVNNEVVSGGTVVLDQVTLAQNGWAVLSRADANGQPIPNALVGVAPVQAGVSTGVQVPLGSTLKDGDKIVVVLHADAGTIGTFEYPNGPDTPLAVQRVAPILTVQVPEQLPETGVTARAWMALAAAFVVCAAGVLLRGYPAR